MFFSLFSSEFIMLLQSTAFKIQIKKIPELWNSVENGAP